MTKEIIEAGVNLKIIGRAGTGVDNIDVPAATNKGILVVNTPGGNTISTGELAMAHILALARNIPQATASLKAGRWDRALYTGSTKIKHFHYMDNNTCYYNDNNNINRIVMTLMIIIRSII